MTSITVKRTLSEIALNDIMPWLSLHFRGLGKFYVAFTGHELATSSWATDSAQ